MVLPRLFLLAACMGVCMILPVSLADPINPRLFGFSSYLGPIVNLTFDDPGILRVAQVLRIGGLRYPGGSTANSWNISDGRWVDGQGWQYANRTNAFPRGTFTPVKYMSGISSLTKSNPIWNLNLVSIPNPPGQLDTLKAMMVPVDFIELGNEKADEPLLPYLQAAAPVVSRTRALFPDAKISVIGCFGLGWGTCAPVLKQHVNLFDAVTIHQYGPTNATITKHANTDTAQRSATLAAIRPTLTQMEAKVATQISPQKPIWLDEFNWGGSWSGEVTWPTETHGALRGMLWASYVLSAFEITTTAKAQGRSGFDALMYYSLFYQKSSSWSYWASCALVSDHSNEADEVAFDGVSQIIAHVNFVAFAQGYDSMSAKLNFSTSMVPAWYGVGGGNCVVAALFSSTSTDNTNTTLIALNMCETDVVLKDNLPIVGETISQWHRYDGRDKGRGWVLADDIESLLTPPWIAGPINVTTSTASTIQTLPSLSLNIINFSKINVV
eukprot:m.187294 g.187294  ORF g.187294 m.187294 type:complete len:497 (+) comp32299_c0_seq1:69-1559(+)